MSTKRPPAIIPQDPPPPPPKEIKPIGDDLPETERKKPPTESPKHSNHTKKSKRRNTPFHVQIIKDHSQQTEWGKGTGGFGPLANMVRGACILEID